jgi:tetratricopeptide (TPR) repeat protein
MRKILLFATISYLLFSCSSYHREQRVAYQKLEGWDKLLYDRPEDILDSLKYINTKSFSDKNSAYHTLLITIARNKTGQQQKDDSTLFFAINYFKNKKDYNNLCRALLYKGIILYNLNGYGYVRAKAHFTSALETYQKRRLNNPLLEAQIYRYLGKINRVNSDYPESEKYLKLSIQICDSLKNNYESELARLDLFWTFMVQQKHKEALLDLRSFIYNDKHSPIIEYNYYNALASYYSAVQKHELHLKYLRKMLTMKDNIKLFGLNHSDIYFSIAKHYQKFSMLDSALYYARQAVDIAPRLNRAPSSYYKFLADLYSEVGDQESAIRNYKKAYPNTINTSTRAAKILFEYDNQYITITKETIRAKEKEHITRLYVFIFGLSICLFSLIIVLRLRYLTHKKNLEESDKRNNTMEKELNKARFVNLIHETSAGVLPKLVEDVNKNANRSRKFSSELSEDLSSSINNLRSLSKNNLSAIAQSDDFLSANPYVKYLTSLSDLETIILILVELKFCTKEISEQLNTTQARVRAIKAKIRDKILATEGLPFDPFSTFLILKKEQNNH